MSKKSVLPQSPRHVMIYDEDWEFFKQMYDRQYGMKPIGVNFVIKEILHLYAKRLKANANLAGAGVITLADLGEVESAAREDAGQ